MKKKLICLACILCLLLSAAACSSSKGGPSGSSEASSASEAEESTVPEAAPSETEESAAPEPEASEEEESIAPETAEIPKESSAPEPSEDPETEEESAAEEKAAAEESVKIAFETVDLEGNPVSSEEIFAENKITMVNLWGTYCGPCIREMPDLEVLSGRLKEKGCGIIGVVLDVWDAEDSEMTGYAGEILSYTGVTYRNLIPWESIMEDLPCEFIPTTYFIDQEGKIIGEAAVGARGADEYEALIDALLA